MRRAPAVVVASAAGFAGMVAMHTGGAPSVVTGTGPSVPVSSSTTDEPLYNRRPGRERPAQPSEQPSSTATACSP